MSCFDMLICKLELLGEKPHPDTLTEDAFQFKEFGCNTSTYEIDDNKELVLKIDRSNGVDAHLHNNYTGELELVGRAKDYIANFENGFFVNAKRILQPFDGKEFFLKRPPGMNRLSVEDARKMMVEVCDDLGMELPEGFSEGKYYQLTELPKNA